MEQVAAPVEAYVVELCRAIAHCSQLEQLISVLQTACDVFFNKSATTHESIDDYELSLALQELLNTLEDVQITRQDLQTALYSGPFEQLSDTLLTYVAADWLARFTLDQQQQLLEIWYTQCPTVSLLQTLSIYLSQLRPTSNRRRSSTRVTLPGADLAMNIIENRLTTSSADGYSDLVQHIANHPNQIEKVSGLLAALPDLVSAHDGPLSLQPGTGFIDTTLDSLLLLLQKNDSDDTNKYTTTRFIAAVVDRFVSRGHTTVTVACLLHQLDERQVIVSSVLAAIDNTSAMEKILEAILCQLPSLHSKNTSPLQQLALLLSEVSLTNRPDVVYFTTDKLLLNKTLPLESLKLLVSYLATKDKHSLADIAAKLAKVWSNKPCIQRLPTPQQAYMTAALVLLLEHLPSSRAFEQHVDLMPTVLKGVSTRLDSPMGPVRRQGMRVGAAMSRLLTPESSQELFGDQDLGLLDEEYWWALDYSTTTTEYVEKNKKKPAATNGNHSLNATRTNNTTDTIDAISEEAPSTLPSDSDDDDDEFEQYDVDDESDEENLATATVGLQLRDLTAMLQKSEDDYKGQLKALKTAQALIRAHPDELEHYSLPLLKSLLYTNVPRWADEEGKPGEDSFEKQRFMSIVSLVTEMPEQCGVALAIELYSPSLDVHRRALLLEGLSCAAKELSQPGSVLLPLTTSSSSVDSPLLTRKRPARTTTINRFAPVALKWASALLRECDATKHGIDLFGRDSYLLGRLLLTLGTFTELTASTPTIALPLSAAVLELLKGKNVHDNPEPYVRRTALLAASQVILALPSSLLATALITGNMHTDDDNGQDTAVLERIKWLQQWTQSVLDSDTDSSCRSMAEGCRQIQAGRTAEGLASLEQSSFMSDGLGVGNGGISLSSISRGGQQQTNKVSIQVPRIDDLKLL